MPEMLSTSPLTLIIVLGALALLPFALIMVTSFVKVAVVLSLLRTAIGVQQVPPNQVITGLSIVLSVYIMAPVGMQAYDSLEPQLQHLEQSQRSIALDDLRDISSAVANPVRTFLLKHSDPLNRQLLFDLAREMRTDQQARDLRPDNLIIAIPAFVVTELEEAFTIGFLLFLPFIVVDLVVANILLSLGMHMLSPTTISLPFKLLLFVLVDGWFLVVKGLVLGYA